MKFPVQDGASTEGLGVSHGMCPICKKSGVGEPGNFAYVNAGALLAITKRSAAPDDSIKAFFTIGFHGSHSSNSSSASLDIVKEPSIGQFEFYFCSTTCLRAFFGACVDELERKLQGGT